jgi:hypothetical protein
MPKLANVLCFHCQGRGHTTRSCTQIIAEFNGEWEPTNKLEISKKSYKGKGYEPKIPKRIGCPWQKREQQPRSKRIKQGGLDGNG